MDFTNYFQGLQHLKLFYNVGIRLERWENLEDEKQRITVLFFIHFGVCSDNKETNVYVLAGKHDSFQGTPTHTLWIKVIYRSFNVLSWRTVFFLFDD